MFIVKDDVQLYTTSFGRGPRTLLALGGWAGSWELWTEPFGYLSETWRTIAYDHRGTGATLAPVEWITIENLVKDVFTVLEAHNIDQCVLAAESAGAATAIQAALQHPQRFKGLILVDGLYYNPRPTTQDPFLMGLKQNFQATIEQFVNAGAPEPESVAVRHWGSKILNRCSQEAAIQLYECMLGLDLRSEVSRITQPTLIMHGDHDQIVPLQSSEWLVSQIPNAHLHIFQGAGHVPTMTQPREVADIINRYFERIIPIEE